MSRGKFKNNVQIPLLVFKESERLRAILALVCFTASYTCNLSSEPQKSSSTSSQEEFIIRNAIYVHTFNDSNSIAIALDSLTSIQYVYLIKRSQSDVEVALADSSLPHEVFRPVNLEISGDDFAELILWTCSNRCDMNIYGICSGGVLTKYEKSLSIPNITPIDDENGYYYSATSFGCYDVYSELWSFINCRVERLGLLTIDACSGQNLIEDSGGMQVELVSDTITLDNVSDFWTQFPINFQK